MRRNGMRWHAIACGRLGLDLPFHARFLFRLVGSKAFQAHAVPLILSPTMPSEDSCPARGVATQSTSQLPGGFLVLVAVVRSTSTKPKSQLPLLSNLLLVIHTVRPRAGHGVRATRCANLPGALHKIKLGTNSFTTPFK